MQDSSRTEAGGARFGAEALFHAFNRLLQTGFLYPSNNPRVLSACAAFAALLRSEVSNGQQLAIELLADGRIRIGERSFDPRRQEVTWVRERLARAQLTAVSFRAGVAVPSLAEFASALRQCFPPGAPTFAALWTGRDAGLRPIFAPDSEDAMPASPAAPTWVRTEPGDAVAAAPARPPEHLTLAEAALRVDDDPETLLAELATMPTAPRFADELDEPLCADELLGTCLHVLARGRDNATAIENTVHHIDHLLATPTPRQHRILGAYLRLSRSGKLSIDPQAQARLDAYVPRSGVQHMMNVRETLSVEQVARTFPSQFLAFLDGLELRDADSQAAYVKLQDAVGDAAMLDAAKAEIEAGNLVTPNRTEKILKFGGRRSAAIAREFVRSGVNWTRTQIVNWLRRQNLPRGESAVLAIVQPASSLPPAYLADLCDLVASGCPAPNLHGYTSLLLRQFVRDTAERHQDLDRRLYAIRALGFWPSPETAQYLEQLTKEGRILQQGREARAVRQAAAEALDRVRAVRRAAT